MVYHGNGGRGSGVSSGFLCTFPAFGDVGLVPFLYPNGLDWTGALVGFFIMEAMI